MKPTISLLVRELHPIREGKRKWRYKPICTIELPLYEDHPPCKMYANGVLMAEIVGRKLLIHATYVWNGCSPKYYVGWPPFGMWVGTPDFREMIVPSGGHDVLFQFSLLLQFTMQSANNHFYRWMEYFDAAEELRDIYHGAVAKWGGKYWGKSDKSLAVIYV